MFLEKLLDHIELRVRPFAVCDIRKDSRLKLEPTDAVVLHFVLEGAGTFNTALASYPVARGSLVVVPQMTPHWVESGTEIRHISQADASKVPMAAPVVEIVTTTEEGGGLRMACGRVEVLYLGSGLFRELREPVVQDFSDSPVMTQVFASLVEEQTMTAPGSAAMASALMTECLVVLLRRLCGRPECDLPWLNALNDERLARTLELILADPSRPHSLESLAEHAGMSRSTFSEKFTHAFGRSPADFLRESRLRTGAKLLRGTDLPIKTVAMKVGYSSRSHFSRAFKEHFGTPPAEYRMTPPSPSFA